MKKKFFAAVVIFVSFAGYIYGGDESDFKLYIGENKSISVNSPSKIVIGNPNIMDIANVTDTEMTLVPKAIGKTVFAYWDNFGEQTFQVKVLAENLEDIGARIDSLLQTLGMTELYTEIKEEEGKVFLLGRVNDSQEKERLNVALGSLKDKITDLVQTKEEQTGVEIDVQILEINKDATKTLGFTWPGTIDLTEKGSDGLTDSIDGMSKWSTLFKVSQLSRKAFSFQIDALTEEGKARILSRPRISCQSGKEAELFVGGEKPTFTTQVGTSGGEGTTVTYKEYGIKLNIKPTVTENDRVKVALKVEVSETGTADTIGEFNDDGVATKVTAKAYPLLKRNAQTELYVSNGQTLAIGGLMKDKLEEDTSKTPGLGDLPILGALFRSKSTKKGGGKGERGDSELFITLTPTIVYREAPQPPVKRNLVKSKEYQNDPVVSARQHPAGEYAKVIKRRILENLNYPVQAQQAGFEGEVTLSLQVSYTGQLLNAKVKNSSGYTILDDHAILTARRVSSYPPFPSSIEEKDLWVDVPIVYSLN